MTHPSISPRAGSTSPQWNHDGVEAAPQRSVSPMPLASPFLSPLSKLPTRSFGVPSVRNGDFAALKQTPDDFDLSSSAGSPASNVAPEGSSEGSEVDFEIFSVLHSGTRHELDKVVQALGDPALAGEFRAEHAFVNWQQMGPSSSVVGEVAAYLFDPLRHGRGKLSEGPGASRVYPKPIDYALLLDACGKTSNVHLRASAAEYFEFLGPDTRNARSPEMERERRVRAAVVWMLHDTLTCDAIAWSLPPGSPTNSPAPSDAGEADDAETVLATPVGIAMNRNADGTGRQGGGGSSARQNLRLPALMAGLTEADLNSPLSVGLAVDQYRNYLDSDRKAWPEAVVRQIDSRLGDMLVRSQEFVLGTLPLALENIDERQVGANGIRQAIRRHLITSGLEGDERAADLLLHLDVHEWTLRQSIDPLHARNAASLNPEFEPPSGMMADASAVPTHPPESQTELRELLARLAAYLTPEAIALRPSLDAVDVRVPKFVVAECYRLFCHATPAARHRITGVIMQVLDTSEPSALAMCGGLMGRIMAHSLLNLTDCPDRARLHRRTVACLEASLAYLRQTQQARPALDLELAALAEQSLLLLLRLSTPRVINKIVRDMPEAGRQEALTWAMNFTGLQVHPLEARLADLQRQTRAEFAD